MLNIQEKIETYGFRRALWRGFCRLLLPISLFRIHPLYWFYRYIVGHATVSVNGFNMYLDLRNDTGIARDLFIYRKREHISTDYFQTAGVITEGDTVLDIGANIGYYALLESRLVGKPGHIYALEPVQKNFNMLRKNIELNDIQNIETHRLAVSNTTGETTINVGEKGNWSSLTSQEGHVYTGTESVRMVTVDSFLNDKKTPRLIRMDVEGYEHAIVEGMKETMKRDVALFIEVHPTILTPEQTDKMFSTLKESGYTRVTAMFDPRLRPLTRKGKPRIFAKWVLSQLETDKDRLPAKPVDMTLDELATYSKTQRRHIHALIQK